MSFVRTLATLAAGYAAAKGVDQYQKMGGLAGLKNTIADPNAMDGMAGQVDEMMSKFGIPDAGQHLKSLMAQLTPTADKGGAATMAGLGGLMAAFGGTAAAGTSTAAEMFDSLTGNTAATTTMEDNAKLMIRAMVQAAKADGEIDEAEQNKIIEHLQGASDDEIEFVRAELAAPSNLDGLIADTNEHARAQVYAMSVMAIRVDSPSERAYLGSLAKGLGLSDDAQARIHSAMGVAG